MLSEQEKKEIQEDGRSIKRRNNFRSGKVDSCKEMSFDEYLSFLDSVQYIFSPFEVSKKPTITKFNKL